MLESGAEDPGEQKSGTAVQRRRTVAMSAAMRLSVTREKAEMTELPTGVLKSSNVYRNYKFLAF